jgi:hypothetical protein
MVFCLALKALNHAEYSGKGKVAPEPVSLKLSCAREGLEVKTSSGRARASERFTLTLLCGATVRALGMAGPAPTQAGADRTARKIALSLQDR